MLGALVDAFSLSGLHLHEALKDGSMLVWDRVTLRNLAAHYARLLENTLCERMAKQSCRRKASRQNPPPLSREALPAYGLTSVFPPTSEIDYGVFLLLWRNLEVA